VVAKKVETESTEFQETSEVSTEDRQLRVYDSKGDFVITVPAGCRVTFGYFNPATPTMGAGERGYGGPDNVARQTALRIYKGKDNQVACFLGVKGFRDLSINLVRFTEKVTVERKVMDDGERQEWGGTSYRELTAKAEDNYL
jgi:hypothetical protein